MKGFVGGMKRKMREFYGKVSKKDGTTEDGAVGIKLNQQGKLKFLFE
jgi:hypothetical protein